MIASLWWAMLGWLVSCIRFKAILWFLSTSLRQLPEATICVLCSIFRNAKCKNFCILGSVSIQKLINWICNSMFPRVWHGETFVASVSYRKGYFMGGPPLTATAAKIQLGPKIQWQPNYEWSHAETEHTNDKKTIGQSMDRWPLPHRQSQLRNPDWTVLA